MFFSVNPALMRYLGLVSILLYEIFGLNLIPSATCLLWGGALPWGSNDLFGLNPNRSLGRIMVFGVLSALAAICPLPVASCCGPTLDVARYAFELARSNLLTGSGHLAASSNDLFGLKKRYPDAHAPGQQSMILQGSNFRSASLRTLFGPSKYFGDFFPPAGNFPKKVIRVPTILWGLQSSIFEAHSVTYK